MKITLEPTQQIVVVHGVQSRLWRGVTSQGIGCDVFVAMIRVSATDDYDAFERELQELPQPKIPAIDLRFLI